MGMKLTNSLSTEGGVISFLPTSMGYNRRLRKQAEKIAAAEKALKSQQDKIAEGKGRVGDLRLNPWWNELPLDIKQYAETVCVTKGYSEANQLVEKVGMEYHRGQIRSVRWTYI